MSVLIHWYWIWKWLSLPVSDSVCIRFLFCLVVGIKLLVFSTNDFVSWCMFWLCIREQTSHNIYTFSPKIFWEWSTIYTLYVHESYITPIMFPYTSYNLFNIFMKCTFHNYNQFCGYYDHIRIRIFLKM